MNSKIPRSSEQKIQINIENRENIKQNTNKRIQENKTQTQRIEYKQRNHTFIQQS